MHAGHPFLFVPESLRDFPPPPRPSEEAPFYSSSAFCPIASRENSSLNFEFLESLRGTVLAGHPLLFVWNRRVTCPPPPSEEAPFPRSSAFCPIASGENSSRSVGEKSVNVAIGFKVLLH
ncbi:hypothetical protein CEXT_200871 [Caerostris extrusa]|uniref:Uncharacterized protein n=1 Tax=Caerostris extrusa TaxID=172846 RepID=A0AAV4RA53_CAEEX|nr:hypothetical protein CEXT_200871 [Caerostris extrusa]